MLDTWIKKIAYEALQKISILDPNYFAETRVRSAFTLEDAAREFKLYPEKIGSPPIEAVNDLLGGKIGGGVGWWICAPFYNIRAERTDLELQLSIRGTESDYIVELDGILVP